MPTVLSAFRSAAAAALAGLSLALAGCAGEGPVKTTAEAIGIATTPQDSKDFVVATRKPGEEYIPVGTRIPVDTLCAGPKPPAPYTASGQAARFTAPRAMLLPGEACKPRANFENIEKSLVERQKANDATASQAKALGQALPPPKPAEPLPTN